MGSKSPLFYSRIVDTISMTGIYLIKNKENGKIYVGSSLDVFERWKSHVQELNSRTHHSKKLQDDFNEFGLRSFSFEIEAFCPKWTLPSEEEKCIRKYDAVISGYNNTYKTNRATSEKPQVQTNKISVATQIPVRRYAKGDRVAFQEFSSMSHAAEELGYSLSKVVSLCLGEVLEKGYRWSFAEPIADAEYFSVFGVADQKSRYMHFVDKSWKIELTHKVFDENGMRLEEKQPISVFLNYVKEKKEKLCIVSYFGPHYGIKNACNLAKASRSETESQIKDLCHRGVLLASFCPGILTKGEFDRMLAMNINLINKSTNTKR
jgi:hypothetical protein